MRASKNVSRESLKDALKSRCQRKKRRPFATVAAIVAVIFTGIGLIIDTPVFQEPKYRYVTRETFMNYEEETIYYLPGIYECIMNENNEWLENSLIELVEVKLSSGLAMNTYINFDVYDSEGYTKDGYCIAPVYVSEKPTGEEKINLKTFEEGQTIYFPLSISAPVYDTKDGKKIYSSEELNNMDKILIKYLPQSLEYTNGEWEKIPIIKKVKHKKSFEGMKNANPITKNSEK